jgi:hypothetical protein
MTITSYTILYGGIVPYSRIWEFCHPYEQWEHGNDEQREWVVDYLHYRSQAGPVSDYLRGFHREAQKKFLNHPLFSVFAINIPHDQVYSFDEKEGDYAAIGIVTFPKDSSCLWKDFKVEPNEEKYAALLNKFKGSPLYDLLKKPRLLIVQDDCGCCT